MATGRVPSLDGVRACAFLLVFASHAALPGANGALGVTIFFFLSGYLITTLLLREEALTGTVDLRGFWGRRALRILPLFYLVLAATALLTVIAARQAELRPLPLLAQSLHLSNYLFAYAGEAGTPIGTATYWSLGVEEHFYVLFPLLALLAVRTRARRSTRVAVLVGLCLAVLAWRWVYVETIQPDAYAAYLRTYLASDMRADSIVWGAVLALVLDADRLRDRLPAPAQVALLPAGLALLVAATIAGGPEYEWVWMTTTQALALGVVFTGVIVRPPRVLQHPVLVWVGAISYAAYLTHLAVITGLERVLPGRPVLLGVVALALTLLVAEACRRLVEHPVSRLRRRWETNRQPAVTTSAGHLS